MWWLRRCPQESGALFLYRKQERIPEPVLLAAPPVKVTDEEAETFIQRFNETLESVDPETIAKAAAEAPAEGKEHAAGEPGTQQLCITSVTYQCLQTAFDWGSVEGAPLRSALQAA